jgi:hypothetical protein
VIFLSLLVLSSCSNSQVNAVSEEPVVDLTALGSVMRFAEITNINNNPDDYLGRVIRVGGLYVNFFDQEANQYYHFVIIMDEGGCCTQGFQFRVAKGASSPESFIEEMTEIEIVGIYQSCDQRGWPVYYLAVKEIYLVD